MQALFALHIVSVAFWLGSQLFMYLVVMPSLRHHEPEARRELVRRVGMTYGIVSVPVLLVVLVTGSVLAAEMRLFGADSAAFDAKMVAVAVVLAATVVHTIAGHRRARSVSRAASAVTLVATLAAVWFAAGLRF